MDKNQFSDPGVLGLIKGGVLCELSSIYLKGIKISEGARSKVNDSIKEANIKIIE